MPKQTEPSPPERPVDPDDSHIGEFVAYGATVHSTDGVLYAVDPDSGWITGPYTPPTGQPSGEQPPADPATGSQ